MRTTHREDVSGPDQLLLSPFSRLFQSFYVLNEMEEKFTLEPAIGRERSDPESPGVGAGVLQDDQLRLP
ncbi:hypothetical protein ACVIN2_003220 [Bradyrhizobium sp. USDA 3650]